MPVISGGRVIEGAIPRGEDPTGEASAGDPYSSGSLRFVRATYSFATEGGAIGSINLVGSTIVPANAVILGGLIGVTTPPVGVGASIALGIEAAGDLQTAAAISGAPWSTTGWRWATQTLTTAPDVTTQARDIVMAISGAPLTAGVIDVVVMYIVVA